MLGNYWDIGSQRNKQELFRPRDCINQGVNQLTLVRMLGCTDATDATAGMLLLLHNVPVIYVVGTDYLNRIAARAPINSTPASQVTRGLHRQQHLTCWSIVSSFTARYCNKVITTYKRANYIVITAQRSRLWFIDDDSKKQPAWGANISQFTWAFFKWG